jgi:hypothetical protein
VNLQFAPILFNSNLTHLTHKGISINASNVRVAVFGAFFGISGAFSYSQYIPRHSQYAWF